MKTADLPAYPKGSKQRARYLRNHMTEAEWMLWRHIRGKQLGVRFRRQFPIGDYVVDFIALKTGLVVEVDGGQHYGNSQIKKDEIRTRYLDSLGLKVIRVNNREVSTNINGVLEYIGRIIDQLNQ